jgi:hypothetical protein
MKMTAVKPYQNTISVPNSGTFTLTSANQAQLTQKVISYKDYEFFLEARNLITDMANDEELGAGYRDQARRLITRLVMDKL